MSLTDRDYMRVGSEQTVRPGAGSSTGTDARKAGTNRLSRSEQVGLVIAGVAVIALFAFAIL